MRLLILFLIRKHLKLDKYEPFQFTNQKSNAVYYFGDDGLMKAWRGVTEKSGVSLNWLLDKECQIETLVKKQRDPASERKARILFIILMLLGLALAFGHFFMMTHNSKTSETPTTEPTIQTEPKPTLAPTFMQSAESTESTEPIGDMLFSMYVPERADEKAVITEDILEETETVATESSEAPSEAVDEPESDENDSYINPDDAELLARVIYQEAGGDATCDECRRRVADIVLNRVADDRFPDSIYDVLTQENQYGEFAWTGVVWASRADYPEEAEAVERARRIAEEVLSGQHSDLYGNGYVWQATFEQGSDGFWHCEHFYGR